MTETNVKHPKVSCLTKLSSLVVSNFEKIFFRWGILVCKHPWVVIITCIVFTATCAIGLLNFTAENRPTKLWIPQDSGFVEHTEWLQNNFPNDIRFHSYMYLADNVLTREVILQMLDFHNDIKELKSSDGHQWIDVCYKLPVVNEDSKGRRRKKRQTDDNDFDFNFEFDDFNSQFDETAFGPDPNFEPSIDLPKGVFCDIVDSLEEACFENNILSIWKYDKNVVANLTDQEVINAVNAANRSDLTLVQYSSLLGDIKYNSSGHIVAAGSMLVQLFTRVNYSGIVEGAVSNDAGTGDLVDPVNLDWEEAYIKYFHNASKTLEWGSLKFMAARSFGDISGATILGDVRLLVVGVSVLFIYVQLMLGKFNMVEMRAFLSLMGIGSVAMAIFVSYGLCSSFGIFYGPVHSILPFLLLGIGIDDMFVIVQCWNNLSKEEQKHSLPVRIGTCLKHAGVSITVTSVTDFAAFAVGATTVLPSLRSFCIYSAVGILTTFAFQASFFVAWLSLDQKRLEDHRNAIVPCYKHRNWKPNPFSQVEPLQRFFSKCLAKYLFKNPVKVFILLITAISLGLNIWGSVLMRQEFNPLWFIPKSAYLSQYFQSLEVFYPNNGERANIYVKTSNLHEHLDHLDGLIHSLRNETEIIGNVDDWFGGFKELLANRHSIDATSEALTETAFRTHLRNYLFTQAGAKYRSNFKFDGHLECLNDSSPPVLMTSFEFAFKPFIGREEHIPAMIKVKQITEKYSKLFDDQVFAWARAFATWETDEIIMEELYRNLAIALACVFCTILVLIANIYSCVLVLVCVFLTLVCVNGSMHFWGLTIDTVSCINLVLAIGLCVDYAAHIAHTFMTLCGTRNERASETVSSIGPAVFHGGFSTFLAFIFLADSDSHVFTTFFKIFILVVGYGLFHGLIFLPVLLSICGPPPFSEDAQPNQLALNKDELEPQLKREIAEERILAALSDDESKKLDITGV